MNDITTDTMNLESLVAEFATTIDKLKAIYACDGIVAISFEDLQQLLARPSAEHHEAETRYLNDKIATLESIIVGDAETLAGRDAKIEQLEADLWMSKRAAQRAVISASNTGRYEIEDLKITIDKLKDTNTKLENQYNHFVEIAKDEIETYREKMNVADAHIKRLCEENKKLCDKIAKLKEEAEASSPNILEVSGDEFISLLARVVKGGAK